MYAFAVGSESIKFALVTVSKFLLLSPVLMGTNQRFSIWSSFGLQWLNSSPWSYIVIGTLDHRRNRLLLRRALKTLRFPIENKSRLKLLEFVGIETTLAEITSPRRGIKTFGAN